MIKFYCSLFVLMLAATSAIAQEESEACMDPSKKAMKLIEAGKNAEDARTAVEKFNEAIKLDESNAVAYYEFGMYAYNKALEAYDRDPNPAAGDRLFKKAEEMFLSTIEACPDYHSDCLYYLGVINYSQNKMDLAIKWFKAFKAYKHDEPSKFDDDHAERLHDVNEVIGELEYENKVLNEAVPFNPVIVKNVSTVTNEYFPMISPDNELIFFTRTMDRRDPGAVQSVWREEFTFAQRPDYHYDFDQGNPLPHPFNDGSVKSYGASTLSVDNKEMIICACMDTLINGNSYTNCDLYSTTYKRSGKGGNDYTWSGLKRLGPEINTPDGWEGQPSLSADGNTLFFTANRMTTRDNDIFVSTRQPDGKWGQARSFDEVNTAGKDKSPFLHQDSETLYFVSQVSKTRVGVGGLDIFYIRQQPDGSWSEPHNIGYPINSEDDELGLFVSIDGELAYFSSRKGASWDIYSFELYEEAQPQSVALLKGSLKDENGNPVSDATIEIAYEGTDEVTQVKVNGDDGHYAAIVKTNKKQDVMVTVKKEGHAFDSKVIEKEQFKEDNVTIRGKDLDVKKLEVGQAYEINDILYSTNSYMLSDRSKFILKGFVRFLKENPSITVTIQGHTDDVGDDNQNMKLSQDRADSVRDFLASQGISKSRLKSEGFGETKPKVEGKTEEARAKNRRTEFLITGL